MNTRIAAPMKFISSSGHLVKSFGGQRHTGTRSVRHIMAVYRLSHKYYMNGYPGREHHIFHAANYAWRTTRRRLKRLFSRITLPGLLQTYYLNLA